MRVLAVLLAFAAVAPAAYADTNYGGGHIVDQPSGSAFAGRPGDTNVSLRVFPDGVVRASGHILTRCNRPGFGAGRTGETVFADRTRLGDDGRFVIRIVQPELSDQGRLITRVTLRGRVDEDRAEGTVSSSVSFARTGRRACAASTRWTAVRAGPLSVTPAAPPAGGVLTGRVFAGPSFDVALRVAADGRSVTRVGVTTPYDCRRRALRTAWYERGAPIAADGTFRIERVSTGAALSTAGTERVRFVLEGRFVEGGVTGTVRVTSVVRRDGRVVDSCSSQQQTFAAVP